MSELNLKTSEAPKTKDGGEEKEDTAVLLERMKKFMEEEKYHKAYKVGEKIE